MCERRVLGGGPSGPDLGRAARRARHPRGRRPPEVVREVALRPFEASKRVFVIADAERMNEESQNALLKTLEEPSAIRPFRPGELGAGAAAADDPLALPPGPFRAGAGEPDRGDAGCGGCGGVARRCLRAAFGRRRRRRRAGSRARGWNSGARPRPQRARCFAGKRRPPSGRCGAVVADPGTRRQKRGPRRGRPSSRARADARERAEEGSQERARASCRRGARTGEPTRRRSTSSLELVQLWFRDLVAVASGSEAQVFNTDRTGELPEDARAATWARSIECVDLCEDTRRRLERNVLEDLALESLFNRLRRLV